MASDVGSELKFTDKLGVLKTIYLFLQNNHFRNIAEIFKTECHKRGNYFEGASTKSIVFRRCKCTKTASNQTECCNIPHPSSVQNNNSHLYLESTVEEEKQRGRKREEAHIIYVCDHDKFDRPNTREKTDSSSKSNYQKLESPRMETMFETDEKSDSQIEASKSELIKLKSKFSDLHGEHQKLLAVTSELTNTLQMNIIGQSQNIYYALEQCKNIYPSLFANRNISANRLIQNELNNAEENTCEQEKHNNSETHDNNYTTHAHIKQSHHSAGKHIYSADERKSDKINIEEVVRNNADGRSHAGSRGSSPLRRQLSEMNSIQSSPRFEEQKNAIVDHIMSHSTNNSPRSPKTLGGISPMLSEKSTARKEKRLEAVHFMHDHNQNSSSYPNQYFAQLCEVKPRVEPLKLGESNGLDIPEIKHPLTPDTVRHVLDLVFNRIFEIESAKPSYTRVIQSAPLNREEVKKVVDDVFDEIMFRSQVGVTNIGNGEGAMPSSRGEYGKLFELNYDKLKKDLISGDNDRKVRLLQALRWRITKKDNPDRDRVMDSYTVNDILDLYSGVCLPDRLLNEATDIRVQESTTRLINTIASLRQGRDYLTSEDRLLKRILLKKIKDLRNVSSPVIRNMLLASVQKLSIRKQCRNQMVYEGLLEVLVDYLDEFYEKLSRYSLEYSSALVMNLCLVEEAKERSKRMPSKIVSLIRKLLESEITCCLPYINGIMFSLLEKEEIVNEAIAQDLDKLIIRLIRTTSNESMRKQLDFILQSRLFGKGDPVSTDNEDDGREEVDLLEIELDEDDFISQMPSGETLLEEYRMNYWINSTKLHPESARTFSEETKQLYHKPSSERGIFEGPTPRKFLRPQGLISNYMSKKNFAHLNGTTAQGGTTGRWPATPLCYMESCQKMLQGGQGPCTCSKCVPGQSRYSCGCYDVIRKELNEIESREFDNKSSDLLIEDRVENKSTSQDVLQKSSSNQDVEKGGSEATEYDKASCQICGEKSCDCAFDPRPKLNRTP